MMVMFYPVVLILFLLLIFKGFRKKKHGRAKRNAHQKTGGFSDIIGRKPVHEESDSLTSDIFKLANKNHGRITFSDVVIRTGLDLQKAEKIMDKLIDGQRVTMEVNEKGWIVYEFPEIIARHNVNKHELLTSEK
jgi:hypothetical protein